ncbi:MAG: alcohol dehydrogenase, partial [Candidatus Bathyarchaeia archaeon]
GMNYADHLWGEREIKSVKNVSRRDIREFLPLAAEIPIVPGITEFGLEEANRALLALKRGEYRGAGVLRIAD